MGLIHFQIIFSHYFLPPRVADKKSKFFSCMPLLENETARSLYDYDATQFLLFIGEWI